MKLTRQNLTEAASSGLISPDQAEQLWAFLITENRDTPGFHFTYILYSLGGLIAIGAMTLFAFWVDLRSRHGKDYAFWLYLFDVIAFWGELSSLSSDSELNKFLYLCINLLLIFIGAVISRKVFVVFGVAGNLGHFAYDVFKNSMLFPFALSLIGIAIIGLGILWQSREELITQRLRARLPTGLRELIEKVH